MLSKESYQSPNVTGSVIPLRCQMGALELLAHCVDMGWMAIIVSPCRSVSKDCLCLQTIHMYNIYFYHM